MSFSLFLIECSFDLCDFDIGDVFAVTLVNVIAAISSKELKLCPKLLNSKTSVGDL